MFLRKKCTKSILIMCAFEKKGEWEIEWERESKRERDKLSYTEIVSKKEIEKKRYKLYLPILILMSGV